MTGRNWIIVAIIVVVILLVIGFVNQNQSKNVVITPTRPTSTQTAIPTTAGGSATITAEETQSPTAGPTVYHVVITATPSQKSELPTHELTPTP